MSLSARKLHIALAFDDSLDRFGGIPSYLETLSQTLHHAGHRVTLIVGQTERASIGEVPVISASRNLRVRFNGNVLSMPVAADRAALERMRAQDFDVLHVQVPYSPLMCGRLIDGLSERTACVGTFHVASERTLPRAGARLLAAGTRRTLRRFDRMMCVSEHAARFAADTFGLRDTSIVPNMVAVETGGLEGRRPSASSTLVAFVGALVDRKGAVDLIEAFALVRRAVPDSRLVLAGDGPLRRRIASRIRSLGLADAVQLLGPIGHEDKRRLLAGADIVCLPSKYGESFGIVLLEAIAAGGPAVIAGNNGGYRCVLGGIPGALVDPRPEPLARALKDLLLNPDTRYDLASREQVVLSRYRAPYVTDEIVGIYRSALNARMLPGPGTCVAI